MLFELMIAIIIGIIAGIFTGITPGIHINLVAVLILSHLSLFKQVTPLSISIFIISMSITHTFIDFIPSVFLGAATDDTALVVFPAHQLLAKGLGYEAVILSIIGSLTGLIIITLLSPLLYLTIPLFYPIIQKNIVFIILFALGALVYLERNRLWAVVIILLSGTLGFIVFKLPVREGLFPLFSGLFGISVLYTSINQKTLIPKQKISFPKIQRPYSAIIKATFASIFTGLMPGLGPAQAATLSTLGKNNKKEEYILMVGMINTMIMVIAIIAWVTIEKARNGSIIAITRLIHTMPTSTVLLFFSAALIAGGINVLLTPFITKLFIRIVHRVDYNKLSKIIISLLLILVLWISGDLGILIVIVASAIGVLCSYAKIKKSHLMGCLLLPVLSFFI